MSGLWGIGGGVRDATKSELATLIQLKGLASRAMG